MPADDSLVALIDTAPPSPSAAQPPMPRSDVATSQQMGFEFMRRLWRLLRVVTTPRVLRSKVVGVSVILLLVSVLEQFAVYFVGLISSEFYSALVSKDSAAFARVSVTASVRLVLIALLVALRMFADGWLQIAVRDRLSSVLHEQYLVDRRYYLVNTVPAVHIENPDQRITDDVNKFSVQIGGIYTKLVLWPFLLIYYTYQAWSISGYLGPVLVFTFFLVGALGNRFLANVLVRLYFRQERREGDYRFLHVDLRTHAEEVAFMDAAILEKGRLDQTLRAVVANLWLLVKYKFPVDTLSQFFSYSGAALSYFIVAIPIFKGVYDEYPEDELAGIISMSAFVNMYLVFICTEFIQLFNDIAAMAGYTFRIDELLQTLERLPACDEVATESDNQFPTKPDALVTMRKVHLETPTGMIIVDNLDWTVARGEHMIITGRSGCGKSSLLRAMKGLWTVQAGDVHVIGMAEPTLAARTKAVMFLPQEPYLSVGSLADQIAMPFEASGVDLPDHHLANFLNQVGLLHLLERFTTIKDDALTDDPDEISNAYCGTCCCSSNQHGSHNKLDMPRKTVSQAAQVRWASELSLGEKQRLAFARLFYWQPSLAVLDEATSALDEDMSRKLYLRCAELNITTVSVTHHRGHIGIYQRELNLAGDGIGTWSYH